MSLDDTPFQKQLGCQNKPKGSVIKPVANEGNISQWKDLVRDVATSPWKIWRDEPTRKEIPETPQSVNKCLCQSTMENTKNLNFSESAINKSLKANPGQSDGE